MTCRKSCECCARLAEIRAHRNARERARRKRRRGATRVDTVAWMLQRAWARVNESGPLEPPTGT